MEAFSAAGRGQRPAEGSGGGPPRFWAPAHPQTRSCQHLPPSPHLRAVLPPHVSGGSAAQRLGLIRHFKDFPTTGLGRPMKPSQHWGSASKMECDWGLVPLQRGLITLGG